MLYLFTPVETWSRVEVECQEIPEPKGADAIFGVLATGAILGGHDKAETPRPLIFLPRTKTPTSRLTHMAL